MERKKKCSTGKGIRENLSGVKKETSRHMEVGKKQLSGERHTVRTKQVREYKRQTIQEK